MKKHLLIYPMLICLLLISSLTINANADISLDTNWECTVGNETYMVNDTTRTFNHVIIDDEYIVFNNTGFNITSSNNITIYIDYINSSIINAGDNDLVLEFCADTSSGNVTFNIDGFKNLQKYTVKRNGTTITTLTSNNSGIITFTNNAWSKRVFTIFQGVPIIPTPMVTTTINILTYFPILIILALLSSLATMMLTGITDIKTLVLWATMFIVAITTIIIITT